MKRMAKNNILDTLFISFVFYLNISKIYYLFLSLEFIVISSFLYFNSMIVPLSRSFIFAIFDTNEILTNILEEGNIHCKSS